ncbi:hypothetical protein DFH29DRAFT_1007225 [Suillus ampliporus]|nr:hypothetical protein DFH29DRAFT_1007225 [Suillus ampliporus]
MKFLTVAVDEAHEFRNFTANTYAVLEVLNVASVVLLLTATPLYTSPKDLCNLGRLARIPYFVGKEGDDHEKHWSKELRAAHRGITKEDKALAATQTIHLLAGAKTDYEESAARTRVREILMDYMMGPKINDTLPPYNMVFVPVHIASVEKAIIDKINDDIAGGSMPNALDGSAAFNNVAPSLHFPFHDLPDYPPVNTIEEWDGSDHHGVFKNLDRQLHVEQVDVPPVDEILVYMEFPMMAPLLVSVFKLHNIEPLTLHGGHTVDERNSIINQFNTDPSARVLLFSSVGTVGLNLTVASIVILFDQCWSRMLVNQIIGRAWRLGQEETVIVYNMVALGTVDVLMVDNGEGKGKMLAEFLATNTGVAKKIHQATRGEMVVDDPDDDDVVVEDQGTPPLPPQAAPRTYGGKGRARNIANTGDDDGDVFDHTTIDIDEEEHGVAAAKGKAKDRARVSGKAKDTGGDDGDVIDLPTIDIEEEEQEAAAAKGKAKANGKAKAKPKPKPNPKPNPKPMPEAKAKAKPKPRAKAKSSGIVWDDTRTHNKDGDPIVHLVIHEDAAVASGSTGQQDGRSPQGAAMQVDGRSPQGAAMQGAAMQAHGRSPLGAAMQAAMPTPALPPHVLPTPFDEDLDDENETNGSNNQFTLAHDHDDTETSQDEDAVNNMLVDNDLTMARLTLSTPDEESDIMLVETTQPTQDLTSHIAHGSKRRLSAIFSSPPSGSGRSPPTQPRRPRKRFLCNRTPHRQAANRALHLALHHIGREAATTCEPRHPVRGVPL